MPAPQNRLTAASVDPVRNPLLILVSFVLIVVMTTASTGGFVVATGKILYLLILVSALTWLATWVVKVWLEKRRPADG